MSIWDFWNRKNNNLNDNNKEQELTTDLENNSIVSKKPEIWKTNYFVDYRTDLPIDYIHGFLNQDYEDNGYRDALALQDISYKNVKISAIRAKFETKLKQVILKYEDMMRESDYHINSRAQAGLSDIVYLLKSKKETYLRHLEILNKMKEDYEKEDFSKFAIFKTYEAGFIRGLASLSLEKLKFEDDNQ